MKSFDALKQFSKGQITAQKLKQICSDNLQDWVKTNNWSWVTKKDYEKYDFLQRDNGVPTIVDEFTEYENGYEADQFGNRRRAKVAKKLFVRKIAPEYLEWEEKNKRKIFAEKINMEAINTLTQATETIPF